MAVQVPFPKFRALDDNGNPLAFGKLYAYASGTSTPLTTYRDQLQTLANTFPTILGADGEADVWCQENVLYRFRLTDSNDVLQWDVDPINVVNSASTFPGFSASVTQMRSQVDPGEIGTENLPTTQAGETERLRYAIYETKLALDSTISYWYETPHSGGPTYNVRAYGAIGDGVADDTSPIQATLAALALTGGRLVFQPGLYRYTSTLTLTNATGFSILGLGGATLIAANGASTAVGGLTFTGCTHGYIANIAIDGNRANRTPVVGQGLPGIYLLQGCARLLFDNVAVSGTIFDNFYTGNNAPGSLPPPTDITLRNCQSNSAHRNGLAIVAGARINVLGGYYSGTTGTAPQAGIDIEPDVGQTVTDILIDGVTCDSNGVTGIQVGGSNPQRVTISNFSGRANGESLLLAGAGTDLKVRNLRGDTYANTPTRAVVDFGAGITSLDVDGIRLDNLSFIASSRYAVYVHSAITSEAVIRNVTISNYKCVGLFSAKANAIFENVAFQYCTSGPSLNVQLAGAGTVVRGLYMRATAGIPVTLTGTDITIDGATLIDVDATPSTIFFLASGSSYAVLRNIKFLQTQNNTVGSFIFVTGGVTPSEFSQINIRCTGTGAWTSANVLNAASADVAGTYIGIMNPDPYVASASFDPGNLTADANYAFSITSPFARLHDYVQLAASGSLGTAVASGMLQLTGNVSANGTIHGLLHNPTPNSFNPGAITVTARVSKR